MKLQDRANQCIAQGALTNSKRPETFVKGVYPTHLRKGKGAYVWDYDNKKYFDFICGLGSNLLGYAQEDITRAIHTQLELGATLSLGTGLEILLAEKLKALFPFCERFKFLKTGSEGCSAAIKIARAATGRSVILSEGYHGWSDIFVSLTKPAFGIADKHLIENLDEEKLRKKDIAAVIVEPVICDFSKERRDWLLELRRICTENGILLIFDEVITGFRFPKFSVSNHWSIYPDLIVMGKAMGNGLPIAAVGGSAKIMNCGEYFVSSTFAGETISIASALETIQQLQGRFKLEELWFKGEDWLREFNSFWPEQIRIEGYPTRGRFEGDPVVKALFFQEAIEAGMLFGPSWFFNFPLAERSTTTLTLCRDIICKLKSGSVRLKGEMPKSPFAEQMRKPSA